MPYRTARQPTRVPAGQASSASIADIAGEGVGTRLRSGLLDARAVRSGVPEIEFALAAFKKTTNKPRTTAYTAKGPTDLVFKTVATDFVEMGLPRPKTPPPKPTRDVRKYQHLRVSSTNDNWVLLDPHFDDDAMELLNQSGWQIFKTLAEYKPGNKKIVEFNIKNKSSFRMKTVPQTLLGKTIEYTRAGPKITAIVNLDEENAVATELNEVREQHAASTVVATDIASARQNGKKRAVDAITGGAIDTEQSAPKKSKTADECGNHSISMPPPKQTKGKERAYDYNPADAIKTTVPSRPEEVVASADQRHLPEPSPITTRKRPISERRELVVETDQPATKKGRKNPDVPAKKVKPQPIRRSNRNLSKPRDVSLSDAIFGTVGAPSDQQGVARTEFEHPYNSYIRSGGVNKPVAPKEDLSKSSSGLSSINEVLAQQTAFVKPQTKHNTTHATSGTTAGSAGRTGKFEIVNETIELIAKLDAPIPTKVIKTKPANGPSGMQDKPMASLSVKKAKTLKLKVAKKPKPKGDIVPPSANVNSMLALESASSNITVGAAPVQPPRKRGRPSNAERARRAAEAAAIAQAAPAAGPSLEKVASTRPKRVIKAPRFKSQAIVEDSSSDREKTTM